MGKDFLNWTPVEIKKRGVNYLVWSKSGKQVIYKPVIADYKPGEKYHDVVADLHADFLTMKAAAAGYSYRARDWQKATPEQSVIFLSAISVLLEDIRLFMRAFGGEDNWEIIDQIVERNWSDPNTPYAWIKFDLKHLDAKLPFILKLGFGISALKKKAQVRNTSYSFSGTNLPTARSNGRHNDSPFISGLALGGQVKVVMDNAAKETGQLKLSTNCNGNLPRFWDIVSSVLELFKGDYYQHFCQVDTICRGQFSEMALKSLGELAGVKQFEISSTADRMTIGRTSVYFLDIPDLFEENPEDAITEDEEERRR